MFCCLVYLLLLLPIYLKMLARAIGRGTDRNGIEKVRVHGGEIDEKTLKFKLHAFLRFLAGV